MANGSDSGMADIPVNVAPAVTPPPIFPSGTGDANTLIGGFLRDVSRAWADVELARREIGQPSRRDVRDANTPDDTPVQAGSQTPVGDVQRARVPMADAGMTMGAWLAVIAAVGVTLYVALDD